MPDIDCCLLTYERRKFKNRLVLVSTAPKRVRRMMAHSKVVEFIKKVREKRSLLEKEKIKPLFNL